MPDFTGYINRLRRHARSMVVGRRVVFVEIHPDVILGMCTTGPLAGGALVTVDGIPPGATLVAKGYDNYRQVFWLLVEHESFDVVGNDDEPPVLPVAMSTHFPKFDLLRG